MTSPTSVALCGLAYFGLLAGVLLIIPRLWRPEVPFGVSVPSQGTEEVRRRALRFWTVSVVLLTGAAVAATLLLARFEPETWAVKALVVPYFALAVFLYTRARKMLLPLALPTKKVGAILRHRRYRDYMSPWWEVIPASLVVLGLVVIVWAFFTSWEGGRAAVPASGRIGAFVSAAFPGVFVYPFLLLTAVLMARSKQSIGGGDPSVALAANEAFRRAWVRFMYALRLYLAALFVMIPTGIILADRGFIPAAPALPFVLIGLIAGGVAVFFAAGWIIGLRYGQGGWRWAVRKGLVEKSQAGAILNGDGMRDECWKLGAFYFNPSDPSILVETRFGVGWTVNLGSIWGLSLAFGFLGVHGLPALLRLLVP